MALVPPIPYPQLNPPGVINPDNIPSRLRPPITVNGFIARPVQAVFFPPGVTLSTDAFPLAQNTGKFMLSMWVWIPSASFPKGTRQSIFTFGDTSQPAGVFEWVLKFFDRTAPFVPDNLIGPVPTNVTEVLINPNLQNPTIAQGDDDLWVKYNGGFWHFEQVSTTLQPQSQVIVESAGIQSAVYCAFKDTRGADIELFPFVPGSEDTRGNFDGRKEIYFQADRWNWIALALDLNPPTAATTGTGFFPYSNNPMGIPSLPVDAATNVPIAYAQVQLWTNQALNFTNPAAAGLFVTQRGDRIFPIGGIPISSFITPPVQPTTIPTPALPAGTFAPPAQDYRILGTSAVLFDGNAFEFGFNRGLVGQGGFFTSGGEIQIFPISPSVP